jgi:RNase P protein component
MKRRLRELFRTRQSLLGSRDVLIRVTGSGVALADVEQHLIGTQ